MGTMDINILLLLFTCALGYELVKPEVKDVDLPFNAINCVPNEIVISHTPDCPSDDSVPSRWCYHIDTYDGDFPMNGFCLFEDPRHGLDPGVVAYTMDIDIHTGYLEAGVGIYFNYQDDSNYDVIYKVDFDSTTCVVGYVEAGTVKNTTEFTCQEFGHASWFTYSVSVTEDNVDFTLHHHDSKTQDTYSYKPHFPFVSKAGPMAANAFDNDHLHNQNVKLEATTCLEQPSHPKCNPCSFAYNIQSAPVYPLPNYKNFLLWYARALEMVYSSCFLKVVLENSVSDQVVMVASKVGQFNYTARGPAEENINVGDFYGERNQCPGNVSSVCVEIKMGGTVTNGEVQYIDKTHINATVGNKAGLSKIVVNPNLELIYGGDIIPADYLTFQMYVHDRAYGSDFGIYCYTTRGSAITAEEYAYNMCAAGNNDGSEPPKDGINQQNWAIKFQ